MDQTPGNKIDKATNELMEKGFPQRTAAFAAAMGYMRELKHNKNNNN